MMRKLVVYVSLGLVGCKRAVEIEIEDDAGPAEIEEAAREAMFGLIEWGYMAPEQYKGEVDR